jgi:hypothetical protein
MRTQPSSRHHLPPLPLLSLILLALMLPALACAAGAGSTKTRQSRKYIVLLCKASDIPTIPHPLAYYQQMFTDNTPSLHNVYNYFLDESYGAIDIAGTQVKDWLDTGYLSPSLLKLGRGDLSHHHHLECRGRGWRRLGPSRGPCY